MSQKLDISGVRFGTIRGIKHKERQAIVVFGNSKGKLQLVDDYLPFAFSTRRRIAVSPVSSSETSKKGPLKLELLWLLGSSTVHVRDGDEIVLKTEQGVNGKAIVCSWAPAMEFLSLYVYYHGYRDCSISKHRRVLWRGSVDPALECRIDKEGSLPSLREYYLEPRSFTISFSESAMEPWIPQEGNATILGRLRNTSTISLQRITAGGRAL